MLPDSSWNTPQSSILYSLLSVSRPIHCSENRVVALFLVLFVVLFLLSLGS